ncbi:MAG: preprotein translocase subunit SecE [Lachnospiraceae bacterium]|nr:preprotein translocase subunit SecE [Lachnospiraceae bacterium]
MAENTKSDAKPVVKKSFFKGVKSEWRKITWPSKENLFRETTAVIVISVVLGAVIALLDALIKFGIDKIIV